MVKTYSEVAYETCHYNKQRKSVALDTGTEEAISRINEEVLGHEGRISHPIKLVMLVKCLKDHTGQEDRCNEGRNQTNDKSRSEPPDRTCTEIEEYYPRDNRRKVGVKDCAEGITIPIGNSTSHPLTMA